MAQQTKRRSSAEVRAHEEFVADWLEEKGWKLTPKGWRHPRLTFEWPKADAARLQGEADDGVVDAVCLSVRGEVWPP